MHPIQIVNILKKESASKLFETVCDLYRDVRVPGYTDEDQDMLLYQYGVFDWGKGERFELDITRQFMNVDGDISQLRSTLVFKATDRLKSISEENRWCCSPNELDGFIKLIQGSVGYTACRSVVPMEVLVEYGNV